MLHTLGKNRDTMMNAVRGWVQNVAL